MSASQPADLILRNGRIYTVDSTRSWASAVAIRNGSFIAVGDDRAVNGCNGPDTRVIDLKGSMAMPGIVDIHVHMLVGGQAELFDLNFTSALDVDQICDAVSGWVRKSKPGAWIVGAQWGSDKLPTLNTSAALAKLDAAAQGRPVLLRDETYHNRWCSSEALRLAGITKSTPNPPQGEIGRDPQTGELTGMLIESAITEVERALDQSGHYTSEMNQAAVAKSVQMLNSFGVTAFQEALSVRPVAEALKALDDRGVLTAWAGCSLPAVQPAFMFGPFGDELFELREKLRGRHVKPDFVKFLLDGVPGFKTAAFHEPYTADPIRGCCFRGDMMMSVPDLIRWLGKCEKLGMSVKIHCTGDAAVTQALDAIEVVRGFNGPTKLTHQIAHASYITPADIKRFAELGAIADLSPIIWYPTFFLEGHRAAMGKERAERFWPNKDLLESGALMAGGTDWPAVPNPDPWTGIEGMVTRRNPTGEFGDEALWPEQAIDLASTLQIYTINSARAMQMGSVTGSIEVGKSADLLVLDRNLFETPVDELADTKVQTTYFEGRPVYERR
ncbi:amidohydrolase [Bradyrhizobium sp. KB893862 SZCCT0404]|uniref:amidohydrolase n=1 Tax=Bradyrhizobium sp. KB893862 SZCCT0404 TaxID=2807672 RepID=UPI001BA49CA3|nr:amidohydrolase [Bradyrhizobium sp. KB893862 SZCCT0404]MBR1177172.1 amidohydrolase [Bradyrhizobium sp. KB893862 SZCCT0404]